MKKALFSLLILIFLFSEISALCEEGQIDINSASLEELDKLTGIGPAKAQAIIDARPFQSIDNLIDVIGIGEITLANIKSQRLACVKEEIQKEEEKEDEEDKPAQQEVKYEEEIQETATIIEKETSPIILIPKDIKSEVNKEELTKNKFAIYGLGAFCILLASLFIIKKKKNGKSEFR